MASIEDKKMTPPFTDYALSEKYVKQKQKKKKKKESDKVEEAEANELIKQENTLNGVPVKDMNITDEPTRKKKKRKRLKENTGSVLLDKKETIANSKKKIMKGEVISKNSRKRKIYEEIVDISGEKEEIIYCEKKISTVEVIGKRKKRKRKEYLARTPSECSGREEGTDKKIKKRHSKSRSEIKELINRPNACVDIQTNVTHEYKKDKRKHKIVYKQENEVHEWKSQNNKISQAMDVVDYKKEKRKKKKWRKEEERLSLESSEQDSSVTVNPITSFLTSDYLEPRGESSCSQAQSCNSELNSQLTEPLKEEGKLSLSKFSSLKPFPYVSSDNLRRIGYFSDSDVELLDTDYTYEYNQFPCRLQKDRKKQSESCISQPVDKSLNLLDLDVTSLFDFSTYTSNVSQSECQVHKGDGIPGFLTVRCRRRIKSYEESLYKFPPGKGIPPEEVEEIPDELIYVSKLNRNLADKDFTVEEIEEEILCKVDEITEYFERLERDELTKEELKEIIPSNFDGPYYPTPRHMEFLQNLDIKVEWPLSPLHKYSHEAHSDKIISPMTLKSRNIPFDISSFKWTEEQLMLQNWIRFQEEYKFFDLRPLLSIRTGRILGDRNDFTVVPFSYINRSNLKKFLLYIGQGLPNRTLTRIQIKLRVMVSCIRDNKFDNHDHTVTSRAVAKLEYLLKRFGFNFSAPELIIGEYSLLQLSHAFDHHLLHKNIKFRSGLWTEAETNRLTQGILAMCKVKTLKEAERKVIKWHEVLPYIRTRKSTWLRVRLQSILADVKNSTLQEKLEIGIKLIKLVYESDIDCMTSIDWHNVADILGHDNPTLLKSIFYGDYCKVPHQKQLVFEDAITHMYKMILPSKCKRLDVDWDLENPLLCDKLSAGSGCGEVAAGAVKQHTPARRSDPLPEQVNLLCVDVGELDCVDDPECADIGESDCVDDPECIVVSESDCVDDPESSDEINIRPQMSSPHGSLGRAGTRSVKTKKSGRRPSCTEMTKGGIKDE